LSKYCGGNFQGIIDKLDYITGMGFDAVRYWCAFVPGLTFVVQIWISPVVKSTVVYCKRGSFIV